MTVPYVKHNDMREFYTIREVFRLFCMNKSELKEKCRDYDIYPRHNEIGDWGLVKYDVHKLPNILYHNERGKKNPVEDDLWA